jgi:hypothetical protein
VYEDCEECFNPEEGESIWSSGDAAHAVRLSFDCHAEVILNSIIERTQIQFGRRYRQHLDILKGEGLHGITDRKRVVAGRWLSPKGFTIPVRSADLLAADLSRQFPHSVPKLNSGQSIILTWVTIPAGPGSGGHTTLFRIIRYLQAHGRTVSVS